MPVTLDEIMGELPAAERAQIERDAAAIVAENRTLAELRQMLGITQAELAQALETSQANISKIEGKGDIMLSTATRIVEALGGRLRLVVDLPGREVSTLRVGDATVVVDKAEGKPATVKASRSGVSKAASAGKAYRTNKTGRFADVPPQPLSSRRTKASGTSE